MSCSCSYRWFVIACTAAATAVPVLPAAAAADGVPAARDASAAPPGVCHAHLVLLSTVLFPHSVHLPLFISSMYRCLSVFIVSSFPLTSLSIYLPLCLLLSLSFPSLSLILVLSACLSVCLSLPLLFYLLFYFLLANTLCCEVPREQRFTINSLTI